MSTSKTTGTDAEVVREALDGPWLAYLSDADGFVIASPVDADNDGAEPEDLRIQVVRRSALPAEDVGDLRMPGTWASPDRIVEWDDFDDWDEVKARWVQAQAMAAGLNAAATETVR